MIRKYHNHKLHTNRWHRKEELHNNHRKPERQTKQSNQLSLPNQDDCKTRTDTNKCTAKHRTITESHNGSNNQQRINNNRTTALELTAANATGGLKCIKSVANLRPRFCCWFSTKSVKLAGRIPKYCNGPSKTNNLIKLKHYDETKKTSHNSQIVRAKENLKLSHRGPSYSQASGTNPRNKALPDPRPDPPSCN